MFFFHGQHVEWRVMGGSPADIWQAADGRGNGTDAEGPSSGGDSTQPSRVARSEVAARPEATMKVDGAAMRVVRRRGAVWMVLLSAYARARVHPEDAVHLFGEMLDGTLTWDLTRPPTWFSLIRSVRRL
ncbi:hypothetical protein ACP70R_008553 [Stipagrostis hirtigluma subsp. patula]